VGFGFSLVLYWTEDRFEQLPVPGWALPAMRGLLVGLLGIWLPQLFGSGYLTTEHAPHGELTLGGALILSLLKIVATSATLGSGGSGGVFAPLLFMGAAFGCAFGRAFSSLTGLTATPGPYAVVGMAAMFAAAAHAPLTAMLVVFEMTRDYGLILPLMLATVIATLISQHLGQDSIYTLKLKRHGLHLPAPAGDLLQQVTVGEVMSFDCEAVPAEWPVEKLEEMILRAHHHSFPLGDAARNLVGVLTISNLEGTLAHSNGAIATLKVGDIATSTLIVAFPDEPVPEALWRMSARDLGRLAVVSRQDQRKLLGLLRRQDIIATYREAAVRRAHSRAFLRSQGFPGQDQARFVEWRVRPGSRADGATLAELHLLENCLLIAVYRGTKMLVPRGSLRLQAADWAVAVDNGGSTKRLQRVLGDNR
jgi:CIC family chloride channel protein